MKENIAPLYLREHFQPTDRLAVVLVNKRADTVVQRIAPAEKIAAPDFQTWLHLQNSRRSEVYISMNALEDNARTRTKADVAAVRHVYLDFDRNATAAVDALLKRADLPKPNAVIGTSPGKWQVVWKVEGFSKTQAEELQRGLSRETGADIAATDCARVLRLPGFYNYKYAEPHLVRAESLARETYRPEHFPKIASEERSGRDPQGDAAAKRVRTPGQLSQSERDWAFAKRSLARGESLSMIAAAIASYRRFDKHNPQYYGEQTVRKAAQALGRERGPTTVVEPNR
jgi:RepB DNA-primase from phage plasmid